MIHPADILTPAPKIAYGSKRLRAVYNGPAWQVLRPSDQAQQGISFVGDGLDTAAQDAFLASEVGRVVTIHDQMGGGFSIAQTAAEAPKTGTLEIGGARALVVEGGSQSGALFSLNLPLLTSLGLSARDYSIYAVLQASSSMYRNQAFTPGVGIGTVLSLEDASGSVLQIFSNGGTDTIAGPGRGSWSVRDSNGFTFAPTDWMVETGPVVLAVTSSSEGVRIYQNETCRPTSSRSAVTSEVRAGYVGKRGSSVAGPQNDCGDFMLAALMIYAQGHTPNQRASVSSALYRHFSIPWQRSKYSAANVIMMGDSIPSGYVTLGIYGMVARLQAMLPDVRFGNFSVPGAQTTGSEGMPFYGYQQGMFPGSILPQLTYSKRKNFLVMMGPGNDYARLPTPAVPADVYAARVAITQAAYAAGVDRVFMCTLPPRQAPYSDLLVQENALIRAGAVANNYTTIEIANDAQMSVIPGPMYGDSGGHPSGAGHQRCAELIYPYIAAAL